MTVIPKRRVVVCVLVALRIAASAARLGASSAPRGRPAEPSLTDRGALRTPLVDRLAGLTIAVPRRGYRPAVGAAAAAHRMWLEEGAPGDPTGVEAAFGLLTWSGMGQKNRPVWLLSYHGTCVVTHGPTSDQGCRRLPSHVLADAETGEYVASYADAG